MNDTKNSGTPPWLASALADKRIQEIAGPRSNPAILKMAREIGAPGWFNDDDKAWCAVYANHKLWQAQLAMSGAGFDLLRAKTFERYGVALAQPALGAILVFDRPGGAHVGFYLGETPTAYRVWGGNQRNMTCAAWLAKERCTAIRWPSTVALPTSGPILLVDSGELSSNEA